MIELYNYYRSSASFRVRIALNLKQIDYQDIQVHLVNQGGEQHLPAYQALNPQELVPVLKNDEQVISQSLAIIEYLEETYPQFPFLPTNPYQRAEVRSFALAITAEVHPLNNLRVLQYLTDSLKISEAQKNQWYQHWIAVGFSALEKKLMAHPHEGPYCFGETPGLADIYLVPQMYNARRFSCDLTPYPLLVQIDAHCQKHPAFMNAWPKDPTVN